MRILYVISTLRNSGPVNVIYSLCRELCDRNDITVLTIGPEGENSRLNDFEALGVRVHSLNLSSKQFLLTGRRAFGEFLTCHAFDVVHTHVLRPDWLAAGVAKQFPTVKFVSTAHNNPLLDYTDLFGGIFGPMLSWLQYRLWSKMDLVVGCSAYVSEAVRQHLGSSAKVQVKTVLNGTDPLSSAQENKLEGQRDQFELVYVGGISHRKNVEFLLNTFMSEYEKWPNLSLTLIGKGELLDVMKSRYQAERVHFLGFVDAPREYLLSRSWVISASTAEGLPMALIEGLECGCNLLMSDIPPHRELLAPEHGDQFSKTFSITDPNELKTIFTNIDNQHMIAKPDAHEFWRNNFSSNIMATNYAKLYRDAR